MRTWSTVLYNQKRKLAVPHAKRMAYYVLVDDQRSCHMHDMHKDGRVTATASTKSNSCRNGKSSKCQCAFADLHTGLPGASTDKAVHASCIR